MKVFKISTTSAGGRGWALIAAPSKHDIHNLLRDTEENAGDKMSSLAAELLTEPGFCSINVVPGLAYDGERSTIILGEFNHIDSFNITGM